MNDIDAEIRNKEIELENLKIEKRRISSLTPDKQLAEWLHGSFCTDNHTDMCGWFYDGDNWNGSTHTRYLKKAQKLLKYTDNMELIKNICSAAFR